MSKFTTDIKEEVEEMKNELDKTIKEQSFAYEMLKDLKAQNKRLFIVWLVTFIAFIGLLGYTIYLLNDIEYTETTETYDMSTENGNNNFIGGDNNGEINN